jgi:GT2 family glycosyltransferase
VALASRTQSGSDASAQLQHAIARTDIFGVVGTRRMVSGNWYDAGRPYTLGQIVARDPTRLGGFELQIFSSKPQRLALGAVALDGILIACKRELFDRLGGFDEARYQDFHGYDAEFTFRASLAGARMGVCERLIVLHDSTVTDFTEAKIRAWEAAHTCFAESFGSLLSSDPGERGQDIIPLRRLANAPRIATGRLRGFWRWLERRCLRSDAARGPAKSPCAGPSGAAQ